MPIFSLPSPHGIGTFGKAAYEFVDFLEKAKQSYWQILPLGPTGYGDSPYQSYSTFAGNPYFVDLEILKNKGVITEKELESQKQEQPYSAEYVKFNLPYSVKKFFITFFRTS